MNNNGDGPREKEIERHTKWESKFFCRKRSYWSDSWGKVIVRGTGGLCSYGGKGNGCNLKEMS